MVSDYTYICLAMIGFTVIGFAIAFQESDALQATNAFSEIIVNGKSYKAKSWNDKVYLSGNFTLNGNTISLAGLSSVKGFKTVIVDEQTIMASQPEDTLTINTPAILPLTLVEIQ